MSENPERSYFPPVEPSSTSPWAIVSLVSGIASYLFLPFIGSIVALIAGYVGKREIRDSHGTIGGDGFATAGLVLGWVNVALALLAFCLVVLMITGVIGSVAICGPLTNWLNNVQ